MKKSTFIKLALGIFLAALSFMQANACTPPTHVTNPSSGKLCQGSIVTITGSYTGTTPYNMVLLIDAVTVQTITGITTTSVNFFYFVPIDNTITGHSFQVYVPQGACAPRFTYSTVTSLFVDNSFYINPLSLTGNNCFIPGGYPTGLQYTDGAPFIYSLYRNSTLVSTLPGDAGGNGISFGNQSAPGTYKIIALNTATGCIYTEGNSGAQSGTILTVPGVPSLSYTWCGTGGLTLYGSSTTTGGVVYQWSNITQGLTGPNNSQIWSSAPSPHNFDIYYFSVSAPGTGCLSSATITSNVNTIPGVPTITYTWCGAGALSFYGTSTTTGLTYLWVDMNFTSKNSVGALWPNITPVAGDVYQLTVVNSVTGCTSTATSTPASRSIPSATLQTLGTSSGSVCIPSGSAGGAPYTMTLNGGTSNITANISRNGVPNYFIFTTTPGTSYPSGFFAISTPGANVFSGTISDAYCSANVSTPLLTITGIKNPVLTATQTADCPSCGPQTRSFNATTDIVSLIQWRYPFDIHWGSLQGVPITTTNGFANGTIVGIALGITLTYSSHGIENWPVTATNNGCTVTVGGVVPCATGCTGRIGIDETTTSDISLLYPNPAINVLNILFQFDNYSVALYNLMGSEVYSKQVVTKETQIDLTSVPAGMYTIRLISKDGQITKKLEVIK